MNDKVQHITLIAKAYTDLSKLAKTNSQDRTFPHIESKLRPYLEELGPVLGSFGISVEFRGRTNSGYPVIFNKVVSSGDAALPEAAEKPVITFSGNSDTMSVT